MGYSHSDIGHNWAHQLKARQNDSSFGFEGRSIRSYGTIIGYIATLENGKDIYLLNTGSYSNSTCKHQNYAFGAIPKDALVFSASCDNFHYGWRGYDWTGFNEQDRLQLVEEYIRTFYHQLTNFQTSTSIETEKSWSLKWFNEAIRLMEVTKVTTLKKLNRNWTLNTIQYHKAFSDPRGVKNMLNALVAGERDMKKLVDIACGDGTYAAYVGRTKGARAAAKSRKYNEVMGFKSKSRYGTFYSPYAWPKYPTNQTYITHSVCGVVDGGLKSKEIEKLSASGELVKYMLDARKKNLQEALAFYDRKQRGDRRQKSKERLERHLGMRGWHNESYYYSTQNGYRSFDYNGTVYDQFGSYNSRVELTWEEYNTFTAMSPDEQEAFMVEKKSQMLATLLEQKRKYDEYNAQVEEHRRKMEEERKEREKLLAEKREYIEQKKAEGDSGLIQLFHEGLVDGSGFYKKGAVFFHGGNALLRVNKRQERVETSKGINVSFDECKRLWIIVSRWHKNGMTFIGSNEQVHATTHNWNIERFQDDIMIAGCHAIHYSEMEQAAIQLGLTV